LTVKYYTENDLDNNRRIFTISFYFIAFFGIIFGLMIVFCFDYKAVMEKGFFQGYSTIVWIVVFLQVNKIFSFK